jgi:hypothetical protein
MSTTIVNGAPMTIALGTNDRSRRAPVYEPETLPSHLAKIYLYTAEGPLTPELCVGNGRNRLYGDDSFDLRKPYANHATVLCNTINAAPNAMIIQRVKPKDAPPPANVRILLDVLKTKVPEYERNADGSIKRDALSQPVKTGNTIDGYRCKWVREQIPADQFGLGEIKAGDQVDTATQTQSVRLPWQDLEVANFGKYGNNCGFRMWAPTAKSNNPVSEVLLKKCKTYPVRFAFVRRADEQSSPKIVENNYGEQSMEFVFKPDVISPAKDEVVSLGSELVSYYQDLSNKNGLPPKFAPFGRIHLYDDIIADALGDFYSAEQSYADAESDFKGEDGEEFLFNAVGGVSSQNIPYHSFELVSDGADAVRFTGNFNILATGGGDGTMNDAEFGKLVAEEISEYGNINSPVQALASNPESIFYDSGFPMETKYALCNFIGIRKDTFVVLSTYVVGTPAPSASDESALAITLRTRLQAYPESDYFGTETMRGTVSCRCGKLVDKKYRGLLPLSIEIAHKMAKYMGAGNGVWDSQEAFDQDGKNQVELFEPKSVNVTFTPAPVKNKDWTNGLIWVEAYRLRSLYYPAMKTIYSDDSSVLTGLITVMCTVELQKIGDRCRIFLSGNQKLSNAQIKQRGEKFVEDAVNGRFDGRFVIVPEIFFTDADLARAYSWSMRIKQYAPNMKTVGQIAVESYRLEDILSDTQ